MLLLRPLLAAAVTAAVCPIAGAQLTVEITSDRDNTLYENPSGATSNGAGNRMFVGRTGNGGLTRGIIRFDVASQVPAGSIVTGVTYETTISAVAMTATGPDDHDLHRALADWGEGTTVGAMGQGGGGPSTTDSVTWIHTFFPGTFWASPGGDFDPAISGTYTAGFSGTVSATGGGLVDDVQGWVDDPSSNHGWIVKANDESSAARAFATKELGQAQFRPKLTIEYLPPVGTSVCGPAVVNGSGQSAEAVANGSTTAADNLLTVTARKMTTNTFAFFIVSEDPGFVMNPGGSFGNLCLSGAIGRYQAQVMSTGVDGVISLGIDLTSIPQPSGSLSISAGDSLYFQAWFRDSMGGSTSSNFTDAVLVDFI